MRDPTSKAATMATWEQTVPTLSVLVTGSGSKQTTPIIEVTHYGTQEDSRKFLRDMITKTSHRDAHRNDEQ